MIKRIFLIVMDSLGIGALPDAAAFSDEGSNTLAAIRKSPYFKGENLKKLGGKYSSIKNFKEIIYQN